MCKICRNENTFKFEDNDYYKIIKGVNTAS